MREREPEGAAARLQQLQEQQVRSGEGDQQAVHENCGAGVNQGQAIDKDSQIKGRVRLILL